MSSFGWLDVGASLDDPGFPVLGDFLSFPPHSFQQLFFSFPTVSPFELDLLNALPQVRFFS